VAQVIDMGVIDELLALSEDGDPELLVDLITMFVADGPEKLRSIVGGLAAGDLHQMERAAHSLKGSAGNLGATAVQNHCDTIQVATRRQQVDGLATVVDALERDFATALRELQDLLGKFR
jgi:HPt (histidine-containing phosphotransfer) domain-containing protein